MTLLKARPIKNQLMSIPIVTEVMIIAKLKNIANLEPCVFFKNPKVEKLVAGPVIKKAIAAPGETPPARREATNGVAPDAQTYIGKPSTAKRITQ